MPEKQALPTKQHVVSSARIGEQYTRVEHSSGLTLLLYPMEGYNSAYALFATKYGSVDNTFKTDADPDFVTVPEGIAHFLEHKMFECEDGDAFARYAHTGASANAYTSFDRTAYLFSCTENFADSLEILLDFVSRPYFTPETVQKEQGIIGQEIKMYEDNPGFRVYFNLLRALYHNHPLNIDIVGTVESIAQIDADLLYRCYHTFYNLSNMVLCIAGHFAVDEVLAVADKMLKPAQPHSILRGETDEPATVRQDTIEQLLPVALPLFHIGFKLPAPATEVDNLRNNILDEILVNVIAGESTPLYRRLYDSGLINAEFGCDAMAGRDYCLSIFAGESRDPARVRDEIAAEVTRLQQQGIDPDTFARYKKVLYGDYVGLFGRVESVASLLLTCHFSDFEVYRVLDAIAAVTPADVQKRLNECYRVEHSALSVVKAPPAV